MEEEEWPVGADEDAVKAQRVSKNVGPVQRTPNSLFSTVELADGCPCGSSQSQYKLLSLSSHSSMDAQSRGPSLRGEEDRRRVSWGTALKAALLTRNPGH